LLALQFLTTLPAPRNLSVDAELQGLSLLWYPAVGLLLGILLTLACAVMPQPFYIQAMLTVLLWVLLTGGLHLDGLADCADAWVGGLGDRERTLLLLKDPLCGSMGVMALVLLLMLKWMAVAAVLQAGQINWLWLVPLLARSSLLLLFLTTNYVRPQGLGEVLAQHFSRQWAGRVVAIIAIALFLLLPFGRWFVLSLVLLAVFGFVRWLALNRLGGFTGDVAGAQVELTEVALLLALASGSMA
jgi:adenosylcobinamide-GDP ribazoletransferase